MDNLHDKKKQDKNSKKELKKVFPLYVNNLLDNSHKKKFEKYLKEDEEFQKELREWMYIKEAYHLIAKEIPEPSKEVYSKILEKIRENRLQRLCKTFVSTFKLLPYPKFSFAVILLQFVIILFLVFYIWFSPRTYYTLSTPVFMEKNLVKINVVFKENAKEKDLRQLLLSNQAKIIDGPYPSGLYVVGIKKENLEKVLKNFEKSNFVEFVEKAY